MNNFLSEYFGITTIEKSWAEENNLPLYLKKKRKYSIIEIEDTSILYIKVDGEEFKVSSYLQQLKKLELYWEGDILLEFENLTSYQRKTLVENKIAFIIPGTQIYAPFLGIVYKDYVVKNKISQTNHLSSASQLILLFMIDKKIPDVRQAELQEMLHVSRMKVSRAVNELVSFGLLSIRKKGREVTYFIDLLAEDYFEKCINLFENPVCKKVYTKESDVPANLPMAGETALSRYSLLNSPNIKCYAMWRTEFNKSELATIDPNWEIEPYVEIELWRYDPKLFASNGYIREIPLSLSLKDEVDERVEGAIDEMMGNYVW